MKTTAMLVAISSAVSASVAIVVTEVVTPPYAGASPTAYAAAHPKSAPVTLASLNKAISTGFRTEKATLASLQSSVNTLGTQVRAIDGDLTGVDSQLSTIQASTSGTASDASASHSLLNAIGVIVTSDAQRLYDTCALVSDTWQRSFSNWIVGNAWTVNSTSELVSTNPPKYAIGRCYASNAFIDTSKDSGFGAGVLPSYANPTDTWTATPPTH